MEQQGAEQQGGGRDVLCGRAAADELFETHRGTKEMTHPLPDPPLHLISLVVYTQVGRGLMNYVAVIDYHQ